MALQKISLRILKNKFDPRLFIINNNVSHKYLAKLLTNGKIIAVVRGQEEFGARALGNRSILADPSKNSVVQEINEMIKNRDFWMPFALTILYEKHKKFIKNPKNILWPGLMIGLGDLTWNILYGMANSITYKRMTFFIS